MNRDHITFSDDCVLRASTHYSTYVHLLKQQHMPVLRKYNSKQMVINMLRIVFSIKK
jgi:hypothetical protein